MELRYNVITGEWVIVSDATQKRPVMPKENECPLCPGGLELPYDYDLVSFENRFPSLSRHAEDVESLSSALIKKKAEGVCEVIVYTSEHDSSMSMMSQRQTEKLVEMWCDRMRELSKLPYVEYIFIFENRGSQVGASLPHPHGQLYAFPFIPPRIRDKLDAALDFAEKHGDCGICRVVADELELNERIIIRGEHFIALVPFYARFPYEVHVYPLRHVESIMYFSAAEKSEFASILRSITRAYDRLFDEPFPYMMMFFSAPLQEDAPFFHFHVEFSPPKRSKDKIKWMASVETGTGAFINPVCPENAAASLKKAVLEVSDAL